ncbi:MAG: metallophosphoesterase family protein [Bacteroidales bacterium]
MKIAFTSDLHLRSQKDTPERFEAFVYILQELTRLNINELIIAGDTFDKESYSYNDFNSVCVKFNSVKITVIPGNHDPEISKKYFPPDNLEIITKPVIKNFDNTSILFMPYDPVKTMDEAIAEFFHNNQIPGRWVLTGHGDYCSTSRQDNPYEAGVYMPLSGAAINKFNPFKVVLGHIHKPTELGRVVYPGSPCGLEINETGKRRFILYDTGDNRIGAYPVKPGIIFFKETLMTFPSENEIEVIRNSIDRIIEKWDLTAEEYKLVRLRLYIKGFSNDLPRLKNAVISHLGKRGIELYDQGGPDLNEVNVLKDQDEEKIFILDKVRERIEKIRTGADKEKILEKVQRLIFTDRDGH